MSAMFAKWKWGVLMSVAVLGSVASSQKPAQAGPPIGINLSYNDDWSGDRSFVDLMKQARPWASPDAPWSGDENPVSVDSNGWPTRDAGTVFMIAQANVNGTYKLSFTGQADVSGVASPVSVTNKVYNSSTNTTTADVVLNWQPGGSNQINLKFLNTRRTAASALNTGITNVRLIRPGYTGSEVWSNELKNLVSKFSVVRMMDKTASNGGNALNGNWNNRRQTSYAIQSRGMAWEYAIQFWNETDKDAYVNVPFPADENYMLQLATLLRNNLEADRKVYVEFSNELWNTALIFPGNDNRNAAIAAVNANTAEGRAINYDNIYPNGGDDQGWTIAKRRVAYKAVQMSNIFRSVFGDSAMMTRVRPLMMWQLGGNWGFDQLKFIDNYFGSSTYVSTPRPVSYYIYGGGGSAYYSPDNESDSLTIDNIWTSRSFDVARFKESIQRDARLAKTFGIKYCAYEGGPGLDNVGRSESVKAAAHNDPRMRQLVIDHQRAFDEVGGDLLVYFQSTGDYQWGFSTDAANTSTYKYQAIDAINAGAAATVTYGAAAPGMVDGNAYHVGDPDWQTPGTGSRSYSLTNFVWGSYLFRVATAGNYRVAIESDATAGEQLVWVDGITRNPNDTVYLSAGLHSIRVRVLTGSFTVTRVGFATTTTPTPTPTPGGNLISNPSFDAEAFDTQTPSGWSETQYSSTWATVTPSASFTETARGSNSGARHGTHYSAGAYRVYTFQTKTGLANGLYTARVWAKKSGGQLQCRLEAKDFGGTTMTASIPTLTYYSLVQITNINVTNGQCTIGIWSDASAGQWVHFDDVEFIKQ